MKWDGLSVWLKENMTKKSWCRSGNSKIILIGEHAVVYGYPAYFSASLRWRWPQGGPRWKPVASLWGGYLVHGGLCFAGVFGYQEACIRCVIGSLSPKNGDGFVSCYQHSSHSSCFLTTIADPHDVLEILVNRAEMIAHMNWVVWMPDLSSVTNPLLYQECWFYRTWDGLIRLFGDCWYGRVVTLVKLSKWFKARQGCYLRFFACLGRIDPAGRRGN